MQKLSGSFSFAGKDKLVEGLLDLLVAMRASHVMLNKFGATDIFSTTGTITFEVMGVPEGIEDFRRAFKA